MHGFRCYKFCSSYVDVAVVDEAAVVVPHCELVVVLGFDPVAAYVVILNSHVAVAFRLAVYLVVVDVLNTLGIIEVHVNVALLVLPVLQEVLIKLVHLTDQL